MSKTVTIQLYESLNWSINEVEIIDINDLPKKGDILIRNGEKYRVIDTYKWGEFNHPELKESDYYVELTLE